MQKHCRYSDNISKVWNNLQTALVCRLKKHIFLLLPILHKLSVSYFMHLSIDLALFTLMKMLNLLVLTATESTELEFNYDTGT